MRFSDLQAREWDVRFDFRTMCRIEDELGYKIMEDPSSIPDGVRDIVRMLWIVVDKQAKERGIDQIAFNESLDGNVISNALRVMIEELAVFFEALQPGVSAIYRKWLSDRPKAMDCEKRVTETILDQPFFFTPESALSSLGVSPSGS